jgi:hypothetical protein
MSVSSNQSQVMIAIDAREDKIASYDQTQIIPHTLDYGNVTLPNHYKTIL